jgi:hypothetical protein
LTFDWLVDNPSQDLIGQRSQMLSVFMASRLFDIFYFQYLRLHFEALNSAEEAGEQNECSARNENSRGKTFEQPSKLLASKPTQLLLREISYSSILNLSTGVFKRKGGYPTAGLSRDHAISIQKPRSGPLGLF